MNEFWTWFDQHKEDVVEAMTSRDETQMRDALNDIDRHLAGQSPGIGFLYGHDGKHHEFIATASGRVEYFDRVRAFVDSAPKIEGWKVVAFRQPSTDELELQHGHIPLTIDNIRFQAFPLDTGGHEIDLYVSPMSEENRPVMTQMAFVLVNHVLGEVAMAEHLARMNLRTESRIEMGVPVLPLRNLHNFLCGS